MTHAPTDLDEPHELLDYIQKGVLHPDPQQGRRMIDKAETVNDLFNILPEPIFDRECDIHRKLIEQKRLWGFQDTVKVESDYSWVTPFCVVMTMIVLILIALFA